MSTADATERVPVPPSPVPRTMCALDVFCALVQVKGSRSQSSLCFASMWTHCVEVLWGGGQAVGSGAAAARCAQSINATNILVPERPRDDDRREYDETDRVHPGIIRGLVLPRGKAARFKLLLTVSSWHCRCRRLLRSPCIPLENRKSLFHSLPLRFTKRSRPVVVALFTAHQHWRSIFCSLSYKLTAREQ